MSQPQTYWIKISRGEAWDFVVVLQSFPDDSDKPGLETIAGELDKDAETQASASVGSLNSPADSGVHPILKIVVLRERLEAKY